MLRVCRKEEVDGGKALSAEEDLALRRAFGRFATREARPAGAAVVTRYQRLGVGNWFLCDCVRVQSASTKERAPARHRCRRTVTRIPECP